MHVIVIGRVKFVGPDSWAKLTPKQVRQVLNWRVRLESDPAGRFALLQLWFGIRYRTWRLLDDEQRLELVSLLDFLDERPECWLLPKLRIRGRTYISPGDGLDYLTFGEFMYAQAARDRYRRDGQTEDLAALLAALYRPRAFFWQPSGEGYRQVFDIRRQAAQTKRMALVPVEIQQGVLMNYEGCLDQFPAQFRHLFTASGSDSEGGTWLDVGLNLARQTGALGTFAQLEQSNLFLVLTTLDAIMKENADLKAKYDK